ncbi:MAG: PQQ-binding-like beta-propeller repeat protein, partial [Pirellulales bacterium]|nr:PQQ-binding-like beta-propeller repeat protein [Pirellulales bacterium]
ASLATHDGQINWLTLYPRERKGDLLQPEPFQGRMLNPCIYDRGRVIVAPRDSRRIYGLDATNGQILWRTGTQTEDVVHLLGIAGDDLIAAGRRVYWIALDRENQGRIRRVWPRAPVPSVAGRGVLAGPDILWPTAGKVYILDRQTAEVKRVVPLPDDAARGANLLATPRGLLLSTEDTLISLPTGSTIHPSDKPRGLTTNERTTDTESPDHNPVYATTP